VKARSFLVGVLALSVVVAACVWVTDLRFKDEASAWDWGVPIGAAWQGRQAPIFPISVGTNMTGPVTESGCSASWLERD
jgi:hypothetical protein